jgi:hypothetical protein
MKTLEEQRKIELAEFCLANYKESVSTGHIVIENANVFKILVMQCEDKTWLEPNYKEERFTEQYEGFHDEDYK